ncbi:MAG TPA: hypothetical protein VN428_03315 [Bryobacteraceae bacterium]|nr:hypothetical protein [Bryobacteraceae bacterium]
MTPNARRVAVLLPMSWSIRNVLYSGALDALADLGAEPYLITPDPAGSPQDVCEVAFRSAAAFHPLLEPRSNPVRGKAFLDSLLKDVFNRRHSNRSYPLYRRWMIRRESLYGRARQMLIRLAGAACYLSHLDSTLRSACESLYRRSHDLDPIRTQMEQISPALLWSTVSVSHLEYPYILAARDLRIPTVSSVLSFDNLTSRGVLPDFDHYIVWSRAMLDQLRRFYPHVPTARIRITGTPQFDFHRSPEFYWPRERTLRELGLPLSKRYFLYAASSSILAPDEPELVRRLAKRTAADRELSSFAIVVRLHPSDGVERWANSQDRYPNLVLSPAFSRTDVSNEVWRSSREDQSRLINSLRHAEACINIASTMSLDAAILDRPVICLQFDTDTDCPLDILFDEYNAEHYRPLVESRGIQLARSWDELFLLLRQALRTPDISRQRRRAMIAQECGDVDGAAAKRVAHAVSSLLKLDAIDRVPRAANAARSGRL